MAFFCEKETVLRLFRDGADAYYQQSKYEVGETVQTQSPPKEGKLGYSRSLEHYTSLLTDDTKTNSSTTKNVNEKKNNNQQTKCKTISFNEKSDKNFTFTKKSIPTECKGVSELSNNIVPIKFIDFKVYFPKKCEPYFVNVRHPETAVVNTVMKSAILQFNDKSSTPFPTDLNTYKFYLADDDGSPEEFGVLGGGQVAIRMGKEFTIVPIRDGGIRTPSIDRTSLVVRLPQKEKVTLRFNINFTVSDIIQTVCQKRGFPPEDYHLETETGPLSSDVSVQDITSLDTLELVPNVVETGENNDSLGVSSTSFHDTFKYKLFEMKHKSKSASIGIDGDHIQIIKKRTGFTREKKEIHKFSDLSDITKKGTKAFTIIWSDGKQEFFESNYRKEIIAKIEAIQQRKRDSFF